MRNGAQRVLENLSVAVLLLGDGLTLRYLNPAAEMLLEVSARQARGFHLNQLLPGTECLTPILAQALAGAHPYTERGLELRLPIDRLVTVDCTVTPILEADSSPAVVLELLQVDRHLRITREENLIAQSQVTRALIRGLAHEIKNPLGGLRGAAQLLERELPGAHLREYTRIIIGEADRLQSLVDRMLGPNGLPRKREINLHQVVEHVRNLVEVEAPAGVRIQRDYDPSIPPLWADPDQLVQALLNIVRNALQAVADQGTIALRTRAQRQFTIGTRRHKLVARIDVVDDGPGIPPELQESIFFPMITGRAGGTGLGLSIAQSLVNQHGGLIEYTSRPGHTEFTLLLPLECRDE
ncbi:MAG TPA: nitrogen regulation protein NR(II) [Gammaproteobacteria bacterium]|nr:nitrogen regulation protein NR(II) [Gammaproteobacteria bacterium]